MNAAESTLHCGTCGHRIALPRDLSLEARASCEGAFRRLHEDCLGGDGVCPVSDPDCDAPEDDAECRCHDACEAPPKTLVDLLAHDAGLGFDLGDGWRSAGEVEAFVQRVAEVARKEALRA